MSVNICPSPKDIPVQLSIYRMRHRSHYRRRTTNAAVTVTVYCYWSSLLC